MGVNGMLLSQNENIWFYSQNHKAINSKAALLYCALQCVLLYSAHMAGCYFNVHILISIAHSPI